MTYKFTTGSVNRGDIYYEDGRLSGSAIDDTYIDFGVDSITLRPSGSAVLHIQSDDKIGINTTAPKHPCDVVAPGAYFTTLANDEGGGLVVKFGSGTLTAGKLYYLHTNGAWTETDADAIATGADQLLGIALGSNPAVNGVLIRGFFDAHSHLSNFSTGKAVYVSATAAGMDTTAPSGGGDFVRIVGYCTNASNIIYFNPSSTWVEIAS